MFQSEMFVVRLLAARNYVNDSTAAVAKTFAIIRFAEETRELLGVFHKICTTGPAGFALLASAARAATFLATA